MSNGKTSPVELQVFVKEALLAVIKGVGDAQGELGGHLRGARINPEGAYRNSEGRLVVMDHPNDDTVSVQMMGFDIAVTSETQGTHGSSGKGGVDIKVISSNLATEYSKHQSEGLVSRITFEVPIVFPRG